MSRLCKDYRTVGRVGQTTGEALYNYNALLKQSEGITDFLLDPKACRF